MTQSETEKFSVEMSSQKKEFLRRHAHEYGYGGRVYDIREKEFPQIDDQIYLDYSGTSLPARSAVEAHHKDVLSQLYGNPHSQSASSLATTARIEAVRNQILSQLCGGASAKDWSVIFTSGTTAAVKLAGEIFPWERGESAFWYLRESHTSVVGLRELAKREGAKECKGVTEEDLERYLNTGERSSDDPVQTFGLFAYPAQCNFSGVRFPLDYATRMSRAKGDNELGIDHSFITLLDASAYCSTAPLLFLGDLPPSQCPDMVALSFYKIYGYPTGIGALIIKNSLNNCGSTFRLRKPYFGGGTVSAVTYSEPHFNQFRTGLAQRYEDGTVNFQGILALSESIRIHAEMFGPPRHLSISKHTSCLKRYLRSELLRFRHGCKCTTGCACETDSMSRRVILLHEDTANPESGPVINFSIMAGDGRTFVGHKEVERLAAAVGIHLRTGGLCNPGAVQRWLGVGPKEVMSNYEAGHVCWDDNDLIANLPTGSIRISLGPVTTFEDVYRFLQFIRIYFVENVTLLPSSPDTPTKLKQKARLVEINLYPIKSCAAMVVPEGCRWEVGLAGLKYDREWALIKDVEGEGEDRQTLSQKRIPRMCLIRPTVDLRRGVLRIEAPGCEPIDVSLNGNDSLTDEEAERQVESIQDVGLCRSTVCGDRVTVLADTNPDVTKWFTEFLGIPVRLVRRPPPRLLTTNPSSTTSYAKTSSGTCNSKIEEFRTVRSSLLQKSQDSSPPDSVPLAFSNESPFLLISLHSVSSLLDSAGSKPDARSFRGNLMISGHLLESWEEDRWQNLRIVSSREHEDGRRNEAVDFRVLGECRRCGIVGVDQGTGELNAKGGKVYAALAKGRKREKGGLYFGQHLMLDPLSASQISAGRLLTVEVGDEIWV